jgi:hypothetical protein
MSLSRTHTCACAWLLSDSVQTLSNLCNRQFQKVQWKSNFAQVRLHIHTANSTMYMCIRQPSWNPNCSTMNLINYSMATPGSVLWPSGICLPPSSHKEKNFSIYLKSTVIIFFFVFIQLCSLKVHNLGRVCIYSWNYFMSTQVQIGNRQINGKYINQ